MDAHNPSSSLSWLLFCHRLPAKPASGRAKIWRKLNKIGAIKLNCSIYLLPATSEHRERLQWLLAEVNALGGDGICAESERIEPLSNEEITAMFNNQAEARYRQLNDSFDAIAQEIARLTGRKTARPKQIYSRISKLERKLFQVKKTDFFATPYGLEMQRRLQIFKQEVDRLSLQKMNNHNKQLRPEPIQDIEQYRGKTWATRANPFVDRMASAWLIKNFIDPQAKFAFIDNNRELPDGKGWITFDIRGGDFSHFNDLCTFEVLIQAFALSDPGLTGIAELVHSLDLQDQKGHHPESDGVEAVLRGIRQTASDSQEALTKGMEVFAALYSSLRWEN